MSECIYICICVRAIDIASVCDVVFDFVFVQTVWYFLIFIWLIKILSWEMLLWTMFNLVERHLKNFFCDSCVVLMSINWILRNEFQTTLFLLAVRFYDCLAHICSLFMTFNITIPPANLFWMKQDILTFNFSRIGEIIVWN